MKLTEFRNALEGKKAHVAMAGMDHFLIPISQRRAEDLFRRCKGRLAVHIRWDHRECLLVPPNGVDDEGGIFYS